MGWSGFRRRREWGHRPGWDTLAARLSGATFHPTLRSGSRQLGFESRRVGARVPRPTGSQHVEADAAAADARRRLTDQTVIILTDLGRHGLLRDSNLTPRSRSETRVVKHAARMWERVYRTLGGDAGIRHDGFVTETTFAVYPPAGPGLPWLAVVLSGNKPLDMFGCADKETAERLLREMRARRAGRNGRRVP